MFSQRHYETIAQLLKLPSIHSWKDQWVFRTDLIDDFIKVFQSDNPNFNEDKFRKACNM